MSSSTSKTSFCTDEYAVIRNIVDILLRLTLKKMRDDKFDIPDYALSELPGTALMREKEGVIQFLLKADVKPGVRWVTRVPTEWIGFGHVAGNLLGDLPPEQQLVVKLLLAAYPHPYESGAS